MRSDKLLDLSANCDLFGIVTRDPFLNACEGDQPNVWRLNKQVFLKLVKQHFTQAHENKSCIFSMIPAISFLGV